MLQPEDTVCCTLKPTKYFTIPTCSTKSGGLLCKPMEYCIASLSTPSKAKNIGRFLLVTNYKSFSSNQQQVTSFKHQKAVKFLNK